MNKFDGIDTALERKLADKLQEWLDFHEGPGETDSPLAISTRKLLEEIR
jgi:hypothetical protein